MAVGGHRGAVGVVRGDVGRGGSLVERAGHHAEWPEHLPVHPAAERLARDLLRPVLGHREAAAGVAEAATGRRDEAHGGHQVRGRRRRGAGRLARVGGDADAGGVAQDAAQRDPVLHARGRAGRAPAAERRDERRVEVGARSAPRAAARRTRRAPWTPNPPGSVRPARRRRRRPTHATSPSVDHGERRPRHLRRAEGGACCALDAGGEVGYWQASHSSPLRAASIEHAAAATRATVGPSIREAPSVRR